MLAAGTAFASEVPRRGGTLIYAVDAEPPNYDCQGTTTFAAMQTLSPHYSRLIKFDPDNYPGIQTEAAESYTVSSDNLTFAFKLKSGIKFHDGSLLTSADVKATFERIRNPPPGVISVRKAAYEDIAAIDTPDPQSVVFRLAKPNGSMLMTLASPWNCLLSAAKIKDDPRWPEKNIMGSGPFRFVEHVSGSHWDGRRFEDYFEPGKPYLDGFRAQFMKGSAMINAIEGKRIHAEFRGIAPAERDKLKSAMGDAITISESPWLCKFDVFFNTKKKPYDDVRVRQALSLAIDRWKGAEAMARIAFVRSVGGALRPGYGLAIKDDELARLPGFGRDAAANRLEAKRLLKEAGQESLKFTLLNRNVPMPFTPVAIYMIDQWKQIGLQVEHSQLDVSQQKRSLLNGQFEVALDANCTDMDEPNAQLLLYISASRSPINFSHYEDAELDALFEKQKRATDEATRAQHIRAFEARLLDQSYTAPIVWWHRIVAHTSDLRGWKITPSHYLNQDLINVWLAK